MIPILSLFMATSALFGILYQKLGLWEDDFKAGGGHQDIGWGDPESIGRLIGYFFIALNNGMGNFKEPHKFKDGLGIAT